MVAVPNLSIATTVITRSNDFETSEKSYEKYDLRKFFFTNRVVKLKCGIVFLTVLCMLNLLIYLRNDSEIQGTGSRSVITV